MRTDNQFVQFVVEQLSPLGAVEARAMFGGHGISIDGLFCAIVHRDRLYLKADEHSRPEFEAIGAQPFRPYPKRPMTLRYYEIGADLLDNRARLLDWARKAMEAARREPPKPAGRKTRRTTGNRGR